MEGLNVQDKDKFLITLFQKDKPRDLLDKSLEKDRVLHGLEQHAIMIDS